MPMQAYHIPNFLVFFPNKPGGEISSYFMDADTEYNAWVHAKIGWLFAIVRICYLHPLTHTLTLAVRRSITLKCLS